jgi:hypothetical protein
MGAPVRVARVEELPPGRGLMVQLGARDLAVYNLEGRLYAKAAGGRAAAEPTTGCPLGGRDFDALAEDSPATLAAATYFATVEGGYVVVYVDRASASTSAFNGDNC